MTSIFRRVSCHGLSETMGSSLCECFLSISQQRSILFEHGSVRRDHAHAVCIATRLVAGCEGCHVATRIFRQGLMSVGEIVVAFCECFLTIAQFGASRRRDWPRVGAMGPCICHLLSYKASGRL